MAVSKVERLARLVADQRQWIEEHGGDEDGYVARYGDSNAPYGRPVSEGGRYGNGGQMIYEADMAALATYQRQLADAMRRGRRPVQTGLWSQTA